MSAASGVSHDLRPRRVAIALAVSVLLLGGCGKKPGGQVVAVVNSEEITQQELRAEADAAGVPPGQDVAVYAPAILDRIIQRNLLASYAHDQGLDRGPEYVARRRQLEQALLANLSLRKIAEPAGSPSAAEVQAFIAQNPALYARREKLTLDQVRFPTPKDTRQIKTLAALGSIDAIEAKLRADNVPSARGVSAIDTGAVESAVARQVSALKNGEVFDLSVNGTTFISTITARTDVPTSSATWTAPAANLLKRERMQKTVADAMTKMRASAKIEYDPAFKPAAAATPAP